MSEPILNYPFSTDTTPNQQETLPLDHIVLNAIDAVLLDTHTWLPAKVTRVLNGSFVDIQPLLKRVYTDSGGAAVDLPIIQNVMLGCLSGASYWVKSPIAVGDYGVALFCERSLDKWVVQGGSVDPGSSRHHTLSDAIFIPGLRPMNDVIPTPTDPGDLVIHNGDAEIYIQPGGTFKITNGQQELIANLVTAIQTLASSSTVAGGPFIPSVVAALNQVVANLQTLEGT